MAKQHYISIDEKGRRRYPFKDMTFGDYLIDHDALLDYSSSRVGNGSTPGREPWRWSRCAAYEAARSYHKTHWNQCFFTGKVEIDSGSGRAVGVRVTCEDPALRSLDTMLAYLRDHVGCEAWKRGQEIGMARGTPRRVALGELRKFTRQYLEHPLL